MKTLALDLLSAHIEVARARDRLRSLRAGFPGDLPSWGPEVAAIEEAIEKVHEASRAIHSAVLIAENAPEPARMRGRVISISGRRGT